MRQSANSKRTLWAGMIMAVMFGGAAISQAVVQVLASNNILGKARESNRYIVSRVDHARRGSILSSDGKVLAQSTETYELSLNFERVPSSTAFFLALSQASGIPAAEFLVPSQEGTKSKSWQQVVSADRARAVNKVKGDWGANGVSLRRVPHRDYPFSDVVDLLVGVKEEGRPATGLEASQESILSGKDGFREGLVDRTGVFLPMRMTGKDVAARHGQPITISIDSNLQIAATAALRRAVETNNADQGVAVVMDPKTGGILAGSAWINGQEAAAQNGFNPLVMARFEPGSTFKILTLAEGLDTGALTEQTSIPCGGTLPIGRRAAVHCAHGAHGQTDITHAIGKSCNVSAAIWAQRIGRETFLEFLDQAGLTRPSSVGLPGEIGGSYNPNDGNKALQLANMGFGQAMNVTPVTLCAAFASLANEGIYNPPRLIEKIGTRAVPVSGARRLFKEETAKTLLEVMESVIEEDYGTGKSLRIPGHRLGGKTGTAQKLNKQFDGENRRAYVANFVGYVPSVRPRAVVLVMIDNPKNGTYYGGAVAGPAFKSIAESIIKRFNIPKSIE